MNRKGLFVFLSFFALLTFSQLSFHSARNAFLPTARYENSASAETSASSQESSDNSGVVTGALTGTGLIAAGGFGAAVIGINNHRRKENTPVKEIKNEDAD